MNLYIDIDTDKPISNPSISDNWEEVKFEEIPIVYTYKVDEKELTRLNLVKEYPNGGKEYEEEVVRPETGHFEVTYKKTGIAFPYPVEVPQDITKEAPVQDIAIVTYYKHVTDEELAKRDKAQQEEVSFDDLVLMVADIVGGAI